MLVDPGLDVQQISDSVLLLETFVKVVTFTCTLVIFPVDGPDVLIYRISSVDVASVVLLVCGCDGSTVMLSSGVVRVVLLMSGVVSRVMVLLWCSLDRQGEQC